MSDDLVERVARAMWMADVEPYDPSDRIPFEQAPEGAQAYCRAEARAAIAVVLEEAAKVARRSLPPLYATDEQAIAWASASEWIEQDIRALVKEP